MVFRLLEFPVAGFSRGETSLARTRKWRFDECNRPSLILFIPSYSYNRRDRLEQHVQSRHPCSTSCVFRQQANRSECLATHLQSRQLIQIHQRLSHSPPTPPQPTPRAYRSITRSAHILFQHTQTTTHSLNNQLRNPLSLSDSKVLLTKVKQ